MEEPAPRRGRVLGFWMCLALVVGNMIGSGVYMLPVSLAPYGWNAVLGWGITIAGGLCLACVFARLASALPLAGGPYAYTREAFGPTAGFLVAWSYWISLWVGNAAIATGAIGYLTVFFPAIGRISGMPALLACAMVWLFTAIACLGVRASGGVQLVVTIAKVVPLAAVILLAGWLLWHGAPVAPFHAAQIGGGGITATVAITLWGLLGVESATIVAERVKDPERTIPRATLWGTALTGVIFLCVCSAVTLMLPAARVAGSSAPLADFVASFVGPGAGLAVAAVAAVSAMVALNGWILLQGELPWAMARDGVFPRWLARSSRRDAPVRAHLVSSGLLTLVVLMNYSRTTAQLFTFIALLATTASLVMYLACTAAALVLIRRGRILGSPWLVAVALLAGIYSLWTIYGAGAEAAGWGFALLLAGLPVHLLMRRYAAAPARGELRTA